MQSERVKISVGCDIKRGRAKENMHGADGSALSGVLGPAEKELFHRGKKAGMRGGWRGTNRKGRSRESRRTWYERTRASLVGKRRAGGEGGNEFTRADGENGSWLQQKRDGWRHGGRVRS